MYPLYLLIPTCSWCRLCRRCYSRVIVYSTGGGFDNIAATWNGAPVSIICSGDGRRKTRGICKHDLEYNNDFIPSPHPRFRASVISRCDFRIVTRRYGSLLHRALASPGCVSLSTLYQHHALQSDRAHVLKEGHTSDLRG